MPTWPRANPARTTRRRAIPRPSGTAGSRQRPEPRAPTPGRRSTRWTPLAILVPRSCTATRPELLGKRDPGPGPKSAADHLGVLHSVWLDQVRRESGRRFWAAAQEILPAGQAEAVLADGPDDLWRAMRAAELAGLDGPTVLREVPPRKAR